MSISIIKFICVQLIKINNLSISLIPEIQWNKKDIFIHKIIWFPKIRSSIMKESTMKVNYDWQ
jgi:hypothetical protein